MSTSSFLLCVLLLVVAGREPPANRTYNHHFEASVLRRGNLIHLPPPLYVVDVYMGGWNEYDQRQHPHLDLGSKIWFV